MSYFERPSCFGLELHHSLIFAHGKLRNRVVNSTLSSGPMACISLMPMHA
jgi:hypothetical protein